LQLDNHDYSPAVLQQVAQAVGRMRSFADATWALHLAGIALSCRQVTRIAAEIGDELVQQRQAKVVVRRRRQLPPREATPPEAVAVEVDGGHLRTRAAGCGPGVHAPEGKEHKLACLVPVRSQPQEQDPQPEPPVSFLQPRRVQRLVRQMKGQAGEALPGAAAAAPAAEAESPDDDAPAAARERPPERARTCVASMADSRSFGPMVAAEAQERSFYQAQRRAFVADGAAYNWSIQQGYFADFEPITDFLHVLCYLYLAGWAAGRDDAERWSLYVGWLRACWQGRVAAVREELRVWQERVGKPPPGEDVAANDPRRLLAEAVTYLGNNQSRMDYPRYRREGLPVTSSLVESLVGEFNARMKGREKFWNRPEGPEPILQLRAAVLSDDDRLGRHFEQRPGNPYRRRRVA
jgi:hypothetical protein